MAIVGLDPEALTDRADAEDVGADEGDGFIHVVVLHSVLVVLKRHHHQRQRAHRVLAQVGQFDLQGHSVAHDAFSDNVTVTWFSVQQHI